MQRVDVLDQVDIDHTVVVETQAFTDGILGDFEPTIQVALERRLKIKRHVEGEVALAQALTQFLVQHFLAFEFSQGAPDALFETPGSYRAHTMSIDGGILFVDAGRDGKHQAQYGVLARVLLRHVALPSSVAHSSRASFSEG